MSKFLPRDRLMAIKEVCLRFPGAFSDDEIALLELQTAKVTPFLTGEARAQDSRQAVFVDSVLLGVPYPKTPSEITWRRFAALQKSLTATGESVLQAEIARLENTVAQHEEELSKLRAQNKDLRRDQEELSRVQIQNKALWREREELLSKINNLDRVIQAFPKTDSPKPVRHDKVIQELPDWREQG